MLFSHNISLDGGIMEGGRLEELDISTLCNTLGKRPFFASHSTERFNSSGLAGR